MDCLNILVVDDEAGMRQAILRALQNYQVRLLDVDAEVEFKVAEASSGEEALTIIKQQQPDILLLDHKLPRMSGLDVLSDLSANAKNLITIMITAYASIETAVSATRQGAYDFLAKPFTPGELKAAVYRAAKYRVLQKRAQQLAREKQRYRFELISVVSHELKAPLAAVESYLNILKDRSAGDNPAVYDSIIERSIVRLGGMRKLILDLLDLARIESGEKKRNLEALNLREIAARAVETAQAAARPRNIRIRIRLDDGGTLPLRADRAEIEIILNNLISNAVKYNRDGGSVTVRIAGRDGGVLFEVADTGIGMSTEDAARIFNDFVRIKNKITEDIPGSGLGLSIVKKIAQLYNGEVRVESRPDGGSTFQVLLPCMKIDEKLY